MKTKISFIILILFPGFIISQINNLSIPDDLVISSQPSQGKDIAYTVIMVESACLEILAANPNAKAKQLRSGGGKIKMERSKKSSIIGIVKLQSISTKGSKKSLNFGLGCAEAGDDDANVLIEYGSSRSANNQRSGGRTQIKLDIPTNQILTVADGSFPNDGNISQNFLRVNADRSRTATINVDRNANQGQVIVVIYNVIGDPKPLAILDPKTFSFHTYTVDQDVYVIPIIRPKQRDINGSTQIHFEVGDPHENGQVEVEEEDGGGE